MEDEKAAFEKACDHFDNGEYFEAHEVWEGLWMEAQGPRHAYLQGLIQSAVAMYHAGNENYRGAEKMISRALGYLEKGKSAAVEVNVVQLAEYLLDVEIALRQCMEGEKVGMPIFKLPYK